MKLTITALALATTILFSCNQQTKTESPTTENTANENPTNETVTNENIAVGNKQVYLYAQNRDTTRLILEIAGNPISGKLDILPFQKDSRIGVLADVQIKGDTLFAMYTSMQEGNESECEIAFLKKGDSYILTNDIFLESNYQYNSDYSKGSFKDKNSIKFDGDTLKLVANK